MKKDCLDIGSIQEFMDGELDQRRIASVSDHIGNCDSCAMMLADAEDESAIVFPALEREFNTLVPTQRLWNKINGAIETERDNAPFWTKAWAFLKVCLINPSLAVAAGLLVVVALISAVWISQNNSAVRGVEIVDNKPVSVTKPVVTNSDPVVIPIRPEILSENNAAVAVRSSSSPRTERSRLVNASFSEKKEPKPADQKPAEVTLPGEDSYVKTIASLAKTVDLQKDSVMRPSEWIAYERDMAVVNDAISKMRTEVKRDPKNDSAKQVLYSSYQNKIDLLNSVSRKEELVASMK